MYKDYIKFQSKNWLNKLAPCINMSQYFVSIANRLTEIFCQIPLAVRYLHKYYRKTKVAKPLKMNFQDIIPVLMH